ncbi:MAG: FAD-binding protein [Chloroflexota bacterium]
MTEDIVSDGDRSVAGTPKQSRAFQGQVVAPAFDFESPSVDIQGHRQVWYPRDIEDLAIAVEALEGQAFSVRSGTQATPDAAGAESGIMLRLNRLKDIDIEGERVVAGAGVTSEELVEELVEKGLVLPLDEGQRRSLGSSLSGHAVSPFPRSLGMLDDYVRNVDVARPDGGDESVSPTSKRALADVSPSPILAQVEFRAVKADDLKMRQLSFPYPGPEMMARLSQALFESPAIPEKADLLMRASRWQYGFPLIRLTIVAMNDENLEATLRFVRQAMAPLISDSEFDESLQTIEGAEAMQHLISSSSGSPKLEAASSAGTTDVGGTERALQGADTVLSTFNRAVQDHFDLESEDDSGGLRLQVSPSGAVDLVAFRSPFEEERVSSLLDMHIEEGLRMKGIADQELFPFTAEASEEIPNFSGDSYAPGDFGYRRHREQYATSSYESGRTSPFRILFPCSESDVVAALAYARERGKAVVARSGGHQYSGLSSGGQGTMVLAMDAFAKFEVLGNRVTVGPAIKLTTLARRLKRAGLTFPHGECSEVAIGGHAQTGGYGHLLRSFGLALDYVQSFKIVLADGTIKTVVRAASEEPNLDNPNDDNDKLFWAVLGGNAGSFGIVTEYSFDCIRDSDYPNSYGYKAIQTYKKSLFAKLMQEVQDWTEQIESGELPSDIDFCMTVASPRDLFPWPLLLVELVGAHANGAQENFRRIIQTVAEEEKIWLDRILVPEQGPKSLSKLSDSFVRRWPSTVAGGREFVEPYVKRVNCTRRSLTDEFVRGFVDLVETAVNHTPRIKLIFQMFLGGGAYRESSERKYTSIPQRDVVFGFVFDLFYDEGFKGQAEALQAQMQQLVDSTFSPDDERRLFWGSFGEIDMDDPVTQRQYYDNGQAYTRLREIKRMVDSDNLFRTPLTVRPA